MVQKHAELLLIGVIILRSMSYALSKIGLSEIGPFELLTIRFAIACIVLACLFHTRLLAMTKETLWGLLLYLGHRLLLLSVCSSFRCCSLSLKTFGHSKKSFSVMKKTVEDKRLH